VARRLSQFPHVEFLISVAAPAQFPPDTGWEAAVAGKSNAGKSSAINAVLGRKSLARTSRTPGRTRLFNYFQLEPDRRLVDLPGYGHASVSADTRASWGPMGDTLQTRTSLGALLLIVDIRRNVGELDLAMLDWAGLPAEQMHVLLAKADKLPYGQQLAAFKQARASLEGLASVQLFSAHKNTGIDEARAVLRKWMTAGATKK
jgi:GTP-binding protein